MLELLVASATPTGRSFTGGGASTIALEGGIETSADTCWGGCMGGSSESFTAPSAVTVFLKGPTSTSGVCVGKG